LLAIATLGLKSCTDLKRIQRYSSLGLGALGRLALALADRAPADVEVEFAASGLNALRCLPLQPSG
jgi:hypothetical protein